MALIYTIMYIQFHKSILFLLDFSDAFSKREHNTPEQCLLSRTATSSYLNNELSLSTLLRSPPSRSFSLAHLSLYLHSPSLHGSGLYSRTPHHYSSSLHSSLSFSSPFGCQLASSLHTSSMNFLPDKKQKPTIEKAVDIAKEKKKKDVVDVLTKVSIHSHFSPVRSMYLSPLLYN